MAKLRCCGTILILILLCPRGLWAHFGAATVSVRLPQDSALQGRSVKDLQLFTFQGQNLRAIEFQLDRRTPEGLVVPVEDSLITDDEVIVRAADLGLQAAFKTLKRQSLTGEWMAISLLHRQQKLWIYALQEGKPVVRSERQALHYDAAEDALATANFRLGFQRIAQIARFSFVDSHGTTGSNLIRDLSVLFRARFLFGLIPIEVNPENFESRMRNVRQGGLRIVKQVESRPRLPLGFRAAPQFVEFYADENSFHHQVQVKIPNQGKIFLSKARFLVTLKLTKPTGAVRLVLPTGNMVAMDSIEDQARSVLQAEDPTWIAYVADDLPLAFVAYVRIAAAERKVFHPGALEMRQTKEGPELSCWVAQTLRRGTHGFGLHVFALSKDVVLKSPQSLTEHLEALLQPAELQEIRRLTQDH